MIYSTLEGPLFLSGLSSMLIVKLLNSHGSIDILGLITEEYLGRIGRNKTEKRNTCRYLCLAGHRASAFLVFLSGIKAIAILTAERYLCWSRGGNVSKNCQLFL